MKDQRYLIRSKSTDSLNKKTKKSSLKRHKMTIDGKNYPVKLKSMSFKINFDSKKPTISQKRLKNNLKFLNKI